MLRHYCLKVITILLKCFANEVVGITLSLLFSFLFYPLFVAHYFFFLSQPVVTPRIFSSAGLINMFMEIDQCVHGDCLFQMLCFIKNALAFTGD